MMYCNDFGYLLCDFFLFNLGREIKNSLIYREIREAGNIFVASASGFHKLLFFAKGSEIKLMCSSGGAVAPPEFLNHWGQNLNALLF